MSYYAHLDLTASLIDRRDSRRAHPGLTLLNYRAGCAFLDQGRDGEKAVWYTHQGAEFKRQKFVDEVIGDHGRALIDHRGWFTDDDCSDTIRGVVVRLPHGKRFLAGYYMSMNGEHVYFGDVYDSERDAMYAADSAAQQLAEDECRYHARVLEADRLEERIESSTLRLRECLALRRVPALRGGKNYRREAQRCAATIRNAREELTQYGDVR